MKDLMEKVIEDALIKAAIPFRRDDPLDFECPTFAIECKRFYSPRAIKQLERNDNVILIQGIDAAKAFAGLITRAAWV